MRGLLLAAGRGRRVAHLTEDRPKCGIELLGRRLLDWQLEALSAAGVGPIAIVTGWAAEHLETPGLTRFHNPRWHETNMVRSLTCAAPWLELGPCLVSYTDIVYDAPTVAAISRASGEITIASYTSWLDLWKARFDDPLQDAETFRLRADGSLGEIGRRPKALDEVQGQYMGLVQLGQGGWSRLETLLGRLAPGEVDRLDVTSLLGRLLSEGVRIDVTSVDGLFCEVDSERDLSVATARVAAFTRGAS